MENSWISGERVTVTDRCPIRVLTVKKIGARTVTLSDGSVWYASGSRRWGADVWSVQSIRKYRDGDDAAIEQRKNLGTIETFRRWSSLPMSDINAIASIIERYVRELEASHQ